MSSSSTLRDIILNMPDDAGVSGGYDSDGDVGGPTTRRRRPEDRWLNTYTPGPRMSEDLANRLNAIMYRFSPLFAHANTVTARLAAQIENRRQEMLEDVSEREDPPSFQTVRRGLTQSLDNLPVMVNDPLANVRRHDPPTYHNVRIRRSPSPNVLLSQTEDLNDDLSSLTSPPGPGEVTPEEERRDDEEEDSDEQLHVNSVRLS